MKITTALQRVLDTGEPDPQLSSEQLSQSIEVLAVLVARADRVASEGDASEAALRNALHAALWHLVECWAGTLTCELTSNQIKLLRRFSRLSMH
jgi:hypothetical protein